MDPSPSGGGSGVWLGVSLAVLLLLAAAATTAYVLLKRGGGASSSGGGGLSSFLPSWTRRQPGIVQFDTLRNADEEI